MVDKECLGCKRYYSGSCEGVEDRKRENITIENRCSGYLKIDNLVMKTSAGIITTNFYDDGIAKGIAILLNDNIVAMLDVYEAQDGETEGEARILVYKKEYAEDEEETPIECITINR